VIRLGLRLTLDGGREAVVRLVLLVASVGLGVGLLLIAVAGVNAVNTQNGAMRGSVPVTRLTACIPRRGRKKTRSPAFAPRTWGHQEVWRPI